MTPNADKIMVAIDVDELLTAEPLVASIAGSGVTIKIGNQLGTFEGWANAVELARTHSLHIFCDTKFKDIPETVKKSARAITRHQPDFFTIMADNSPAALRAAVEGVDSAMRDFSLAKRPRILGVTVLTSIDEPTCQSIYGGSPKDKVLQFAVAAAEAGLDGIVCSAEEAALLRANPALNDILIITPGIRPAWAATGDQARVTTPKDALRAGASYLVIGRPITQPPSSIGSPLQAIEAIAKEL